MNAAGFAVQGLAAPVIMRFQENGVYPAVWFVHPQRGEGRSRLVQLLPPHL
jgi:hypothetical protein